ncbi:hypothetical protein R3P38DRAFT_2851691 [Favolaschia claudopus]|uniref:Secreted protein n=1 Tax=Favolaschia claudopus TaxID=2862362 RepID=A0AAW0DPF0_9AGAR
MRINSALFRHTLQVIAHAIGGRMSVIVVANCVIGEVVTLILSYDPCTILQVRVALTYCTHITLSILFCSILQIEAEHQIFFPAPIRGVQSTEDWMNHE